MIKNLCIRMIRFYQKYVSWMKGYPTCKYVPTCSQYAMEALNKNGLVLGLLLSVWRILRCNPFSKGGYDPVPDLRRKNK